MANVVNGRAPAEALPVLLPLLDENTNDTWRAAALLAWMGEPALPELTQRLQHEKTREAAAWGLGLMGAGAAGACAALVEALHSGDDRTRSSAAAALGNIGPAAVGAVGELRRVARGTFARLRAAAAEALGKIGATAALPDLRALLSDTSQVVHNCAAKAIDTLTRGPAEDTSAAGIPF